LIDVNDSRRDFPAMMRTVGLAFVLLGAACSKIPGAGHNGGQDAGQSSPADMSQPPGPPDLASPMYSDFPPTPVIDPTGGTPSTAPGLFGPPTSGMQSGGPCLTDPEAGALLPQNWLRPRFHFIPVGGQNLFELRVHAPTQINDLVVYTTQTTWTMDGATWSHLAQHVVDQPIAVTVRGAVYANGALTAGPALGTSETFSIAPVSVGGAIVYWTTSSNSALRGFTVGEETVHDVLTPTQAGGGTQCVGCHSSTPDGMNVAFSSSSASDNGDPAQIMLRTLDGKVAVPSFISTTAAQLLARTNQESPVFSKSHWMTGDRIAVNEMLVSGKSELVWTDLETGSMVQGMGWGQLLRSSDMNEAAGAQFSHDGKSIVYVSGTMIDAGETTRDGDLRIIPWSNRAGGASTAVLGASDANFNEFYPVFSPDDAWLAFTRLPTGQRSYANDMNEVFVIPAAGGTATRLAANDPPHCSGKASPGVQNSWPKWAPSMQRAGTRSFYWVTFSSTRSENGNQQLYVSPVVVDHGKVTTYPALYLWNQPADEHNHTPAWDEFQIPIS
jgi:hypothetical protein